MGQPKALLRLGSRTFLENITESVRGAGIERVIIVSNPKLKLTHPEAQVVYNETPELGQLSSLQTGLNHCLDCHWVLVALIDHPAVGPKTYRALVDAAETQPGHIWAPSYRGRRGHPVIFGVDCFYDLMAAPLDQGARWAVSRHRQERVEVPVDDPEIHRDVDTPAAYQELLKSWP